MPFRIKKQKNSTLGTGQLKGRMFCTKLVMRCGSKCLSIHKMHNLLTMQGMQCTKYLLLRWHTYKQSKWTGGNA